MGDLLQRHDAFGYHFFCDNNCRFPCGFLSLLQAHLLQYLTHFPPSFRLLFQVSCPLGDQFKVHILGIGAVEVVHQPANVRIAPVFAVYIKDMLSVVKGLAGEQVHPFHRVDRFPQAVDVLFHDKYGIGVRQFPELLAGGQVLHIHDAGVVPCPVGVGAFVSPLYLQVIFFPGGVGPVGVQAKGARPRQPLHVLLGLAIGDDQVRLAGDDAQHQLCQGDVVLEETAHKVVVDGPQATQPLQVLLVPQFLPGHGDHRLSCV